MKVQGNENASWGFTPINEGWHIVMVEDGIDYFKNSNGEFVKGKKDEKLIAIPVVVKEDSEDNDKKTNILIGENTLRGERTIADILAAVGLFNDFEKHYPGDVSFFDPKVFSVFKQKVSSCYFKARFEHSKDGKYSNIVEINKANADTSSTMAKAKSTPAQAAAAASTAPENVGW